MEQYSMFTIIPSSLLFENLQTGKMLSKQITIHNNTDLKMDFYLEFPSPHEIAFEPDFKTYTINPHDKIKGTINFIPQLLEQIKDTALIWFQNGRMTWNQKLSIQCTIKKVKVFCKNPVLNFGKVVLGEQSQLDLVLINESLEKVNIIFKNSKGYPLSSIKNLHPSQVKILNQLQFDYEWAIEKHQTSIKIKYFAQTIGSFQLQIQFNISNNINAPAHKLLIKGQCIQLPIYLQATDYDMRICIIGHSYKQEIKLYNRSSQQMKIEVQQPDETRKYIQFIPNVGFVQSQSSLSIWFRLHILKDIMNSLQSFIHSGMYILPFKIISKDQTIPIDFTVKFKITTDRLVVEPTYIDFGNIYQGTGSKVSVILKNQSILLQEVMLFPSSNNIHVMRNQPMKILPKQQLFCQLLYLTNANNQNQLSKDENIKCQIITGNVSTHQINLVTTCTIIKPQLELQVNKIHFPVLQVGETFSTQIKLKNTSQQHLIFQIFLPHKEICGISICPLVKTLAPTEVINISIQYESFMKNLDLQFLQKFEERTSIGFMDKITNLILKNKFPTLETENSCTTTQQYISKLGGKYSHFDDIEHFQWLVPIYFKQREYPDASAEVTFLQITTTSNQKSLILSQPVIDFGQMPVGTKSTKTCILKNINEFSQIWKVPLPVWCGFKIINTFTSLNYNEQLNILVQFAPKDQKAFLQKLTIHSDKSLVSCYLKGKGIRPQLSIQPSDGRLNMGCILPGQKSCQILKIKNQKSFQTYFKFEVKKQGIKNFFGFETFSFVPKQCFIQGNSQTQILVTFNPEKVSDNYFQVVHLTIPQQKQIEFCIWGECKPQQQYVNILKDDNLQSKQQTNRLSSLMSSKNNSTNLMLLFEKNRLNCTGKVRIGNCQTQNTTKKCFQFRISIPQSQFNCSLSQGRVEQGEQIIVQFQRVSRKNNEEIQIGVLWEFGHWKDVIATIEMFRFQKEERIERVEFGVTLRAYYNYL